ncbi:MULTISPECIES: NADH-quinone oxidoreductase subunit NuoG [unclassified Beijerinckia]|uniref:NADH-quinone oxidoreductase subunit NuoG n=1 Tax=unclassified Beijerinckia TaxID=2638183 RepID=UPI00089B8D63|nr:MULTISPECIES: NADH-quinone oxidoreductase subunit NuoG [unclassified Beijerinckia]MDH7796045.1 NADH-quinone oxidoreductase subunit G [Beijerinckia sp. GAS462]SEC27819.1 NADH dehydrogenase subunit G [Beijerinckia sp. 28-YEA-48]
MTKIIVDGSEVDVPGEYTLLQACEAAGAEVPRFCFHERLSVAGNCRMCLVEVKGGPPKPAASCAMAVRDLRPGPNGEAPQVFTNTPMVKKAREGVMEFLLINHPLDCPICDQGGECDLQDQAMGFGLDSSRYAENKRAVEDKYIGPLVKTSMNRCIHCTRCVRFTAEVAGTGDMGAIGRGEDMEITTYLETAMTSELQGNVADLCPVGALLPKPQNFKARPWEMQKTESVDVMDALGSAIRVDTRGREVMRILPRVNDAVNEEWISDKTRQIVDGLGTQRLDRPYLRENGRLRQASWQEAFAAIAAKVKATSPAKIGAIAGDLAAAEEMYALKALMQKLGSGNIDCRQDGTKLDPKFGRASYLFNATVAGIEEADSILIVGANPRREAPVLNARIRKRWLRGGLKISVVGERADLTYVYDYQGAGPESLANLVEYPPQGSQKPMIIVGQGALARPDGAAILAMAAKYAQAVGAVKDGWNGFCVLHTAASRVGGLDLGFVPGEGGLDVAAMANGGVDVLFNLGADEIDIKPGAFVIYQGSHGDRGAHRADVILPGAAYTEKSGTYVNTEGRVQMAARAAFPPGDAREDWAILRALSDVLGQRLPFDSLGALRKALYAEQPHLARLEQIAPGASMNITATGAPGKEAFASPITDFYMTNPIARASSVMAECSALARGRMQQAAE